MKTFLTFFLCTLAAQAAQITVSSVSATAGSTVPDNIQFASQGAQCAGLQFDLQFDSSLTITATLGASGTAAGKSLSTSKISSGTTRFLIAGFNQTVIGDGVIVSLSIVVPNPSASTYTLHVLNSSASDASGNSIALQSVDGTITVGVNPNPVGGLSIVSGNNQTALVNATFGLPLVVQVSAGNGQPAANVGVQFSVTGPASLLSASTVNTDSNGHAQVSVQAGGSAGPVTVTASVGSFTQTFSLTVTGGFTVTAGDFYNGADFQAGSISPCSIATIIAPGLAPGVQGLVTPGSLFGPLPYLLASDAVMFNGTQAPILSVANANGQQQITVQVPCEVAPAASVPVTVTVGGASATVNVPVLAASPGLSQTQMSDGVSRAVIIRPDGSFVSLTNPVRRGEIVRAYATGLGATSPAVGTNATAVPGNDAIVQGTVIVGVTNTSGQGEGVPVSGARVAPDLIGMYEISIQMPLDAATGNNVSFSIGVIPVGASTPVYSATVKIPVQ
jgi:uncharacterized protein (TIGR03437 family)